MSLYRGCLLVKIRFPRRHDSHAIIQSRPCVLYLTSAAESNFPKRSLRVLTSLSTESLVVNSVNLQMSAKMIVTFSWRSMKSSLKKIKYFLFICARVDIITRSVQGKFNCITVNFDRTHHGIYVIRISLECIYKQ